MTRALFVDHSASLSGAQLFLSRALRHASTIEPTVLLFEDGPLRPQLESFGVPVEVLPLAASLSRVRADRSSGPRTSGSELLRAAGDGVALLRRVRGVVRDQRPDVVYTNSAKAHVFALPAARSLRVPTVMHVHDIWDRESFSRANLALLRAATHQANRLVANSHATFASLTPYAQRKSQVVYCPTEVSAEAAPGRSDVEELSVAVVGRLADWKGQELAVRALAELTRERGVPARLHLYGSAQFERDVRYEAHLRSLTAELRLEDAVVFHGHVSDVPAALAGHDVLVHTSLKPEPMGQVIVEGMAAALPVVAAAAGGPLELIEDGVSGVLYEPGNASALAGCLERLFLEPTRRAVLGAAAHRRALDFSYEEIMPRWERLVTRA